MHRGVLFLDELGEHRPVVLDCLRQPLEEGVIRIHRGRKHSLPPRPLLLLAAMDHCPSGPPRATAVSSGLRQDVEN